MSSALFFTLAVVAVAAGYATVALALVVTHGRPMPVDQVHRVETGSAWNLALHRVLPRPGAPKRGAPVILGHGTAMCRVCWDSAPDRSMARYLAARGHDVWIAEYRGSGASRSNGGPQAWRFSADHHIREDVPALIDKVREVTGAERVSWVGHSLGGIVLYGYAQAFGTDKLARVVTIGSPCKIGRGRGFVMRLGRAVFSLLAPGWRLPLRALSWIALPVGVYAKEPFARFFCNPETTRHGDLAAIMSRGVTDLPNDLLRQYRRWMSTAQMSLDDGTRLEDAPSAVDVPLLVLGGAGDAMVPPRVFVPAFERSPAVHKSYRVFGARGDAAPPLGHIDLLVSEQASLHVFPEVAGWLERDLEAWESTDRDTRRAGR